MGIGRITGAREVTQGAVHEPQVGAGEAARRIAATGAHAGREAQRTIASGFGDAAKNIGDALKVAGDFAVKALWEKPIAEAEEKIRELDLEARSKEWTDEHGVRHPGFDLVKGAEAARIGDQWDAYMARKAKAIFDDMGLTADQREELSRRTAKFRTETRARLTERGTRELVTSNLADIDIIATKDGERNVMQAVANANEAVEKFKGAVNLTGDVEKATAERGRDDDAAAVSISDQLVAKRNELIRRKLEGGLGFKSEALATTEADEIVRDEALATVKALAAAGHYDRARKLVERGGKLGFDDAALVKGRELVDGMEGNAATADGLKAYSTVWDENGNRIAGRDKALDVQIATLKRVAENAPKGSRTAIAALQQAGRFEEAADTIALGDLMDGIANEDGALYDTDKNGRATLKKQPFDKKLEPRAARMWPKAVEAFKMKRSAAFNSAHKGYVAESRNKALQTIANPNGNPQAYVSWLLGEMENGNIDANDVIDETNKFRDMWIKGTGDGQKSRMQIVVRQMLDDTKSILGVDFGQSINVDALGNPAFDKNGSISFRKDAEKPSVDYIRWKSAEELAEESRNNPGGNTYPKTSGSFTADEWLEIMNMASKLSMANGAMINELPLDNPLWNLYGDAMKEFNPNDAKTIRRVDAVRDFRTFLERIKKGKDVLGAAEELEMRRADYNLVNDTVIRRTDPFVMRQRGVERAERRPGPWKE